MTPIRYLPSADDDLLDIFLTIAGDHEASAHRFIDRLRTAVLRLQDHPLSAPAREQISPDLRGLSVGHYVVYYIYASEEVIITRILHSARDVSAENFPDP